MTTYVEVAVNVPQVSGTFHYHLPPELEGQVQPGHLVEVPFGRQQVQGVVFRFVDQPEVPETKSVTSLLDPLAVLTPQQIRLAGELAESTLAPLAACIDAKSSWPRVEADLAEGKRLNVVSTPTAFINGRMLIGLPSPEAYYQTVDEALRGAK